MHGNKSQNQRQPALAQFASGEVDTLVATDVAARGIDVDDITHVINFDAPGDRDAYVHRVGRTGRAGRDGAGVSFVAPRPGRRDAQDRRDLGLAREFDHGHPKPSDGADASPPPRHRSPGRRNHRPSRNRRRR